MSSIWALGLNHQTAPLDLRSRFSFAPDATAHALHGLRSQFAQQPEAAILSTCNRTEIYCASSHASLDDALNDTLHWLAQTGNVPAHALRKHTYTLQNAQATRHAFRVASGLDSMVLGEPQILGQMKTAMRTAQHAGSLGGTLNQLFQRSFAVAKQVRSSTNIGTQSVSMAAAVLKLAAQHMQNNGKQLQQAHVLFVGAGEMTQLVCTHFAAKQPAGMVISNRNPAKAAKLASRAGASHMPLADLPEQLSAFDVVVSCTASTLPLIGLGAVERAMKKRQNRPMLLVDLAVPRDTEPEIAALPNVNLYTVDDMAALVQRNQASRQAAVAQAEAMIDSGVHRFMHWLNKRHTPTNMATLVGQLQQQTANWQQQELQRAQKHMARGVPVEQVLANTLRRLSNKMLHGSLRELHHSSPAAQQQLAETLQKLFLQSRS